MLNIEPLAASSSSDLSAFLSRLLLCCLDVQEIWSIGHDGLARARPSQDHELLVFADPSTLQTLRRSDALHRADIRILVVHDGDQFESAWGPDRISGSLARWAWRPVGYDVAYYDESIWDGVEASGAVTRVRRKALLLWPEPLARPG